jgi:uncharacterized protein (UPF0276 family)
MRHAAHSGNPGFGLGLRTVHHEAYFSGPTAVDWLEIISDNFMVQGGRPHQVLERLRPDYPMAMHGVAMSLASAQGPDPQYLQRLKQLVDWVQPMWVSDHLCWTGLGTTHLHDLNPVAYTDESARLVIAAIRRAQDVLKRRLLIENVSSYVQFATSGASEWQFLAHVAQEADCLLLLDVNNIYVSSVNHGFDPMTYLRALPAHRIKQIHLAGHSRQGDHIIDTHDHPICPEVWDLYAQTCQWLGPVACMIERDDHIPALEDLVQELQIARDISRQHCPPTPSPVVRLFEPPQALAQAAPQDRSDWVSLQRDWVSSILQPDLTLDAPIMSHLHAGHHFEVYHHAYTARLAEALADTFEKTMLYMGRTLFEGHAQQLALHAPPKVNNLNDYGFELIAALKAAYPQQPVLSELAALEWALRDVFDAADEPTLSQSSVSHDTELQWLHRLSPLVQHACLLPVTTQVTLIWNAIHQDAEVPEVQAVRAPTWLLVWRRGLQPSFLSVGGTEARLLELMLSGLSIAQAHEQCADLIQTEDGQFMATCLQRWLELGWLSAPGLEFKTPARHGSEAPARPVAA